MKVVRILLGGLIALGGIYLVLCFLGPKKFETSKSISINADAATVYAMVSDFNQWSQWSPWAKRDSKMINTITGSAGTVGHKMDWVSESEGSGSLTIDEVIADQKVTTSLKMVDWDAISHASFIIEPDGSATKLTWTMDGGEIAFGFRGLMVAMGAVGRIEKDYTDGLASIKSAIEN
jgi:carbon monoxide dehydrogenase subunit G